MKKTLILLLINLILVLIQMAFLTELFNKTVVPNLILVLGVYFLLKGDLVTGLKSVFIGGILIDALNYTHMGTSALILVAGLYLMSFIRKTIFKGFLSDSVIIILISYIYMQIMVIKTAAFNVSSILGAVLTALISFVMFSLLKYETKSR
jgi:rod shape-determining protein MreD